VNALAYNVNTHKVEDWVHGIHALKNRILTTPIDPVQTFSDDPLRILRTFRFALRFNFAIDPAIFQAAFQVRNEFGGTTARERIQTELCKLIAMPQALSVLYWFIEAGVFLPLFDPKGEWKINEEIAIGRARIALERCQDPAANLIVLLAAVYFDIESITGVKVAKKSSLFDAVITKFLVMPLRIGQLVCKVVRATHSLPKHIGQVSRLPVGKWLRTAGLDWPLVRCLLFEAEVLTFWDVELAVFIGQEKLEEVIEMKPILSGVQIATMHGVPVGPGIAQLLEGLIDWQILHPGEGVDEYTQFVSGH
jgi:tRNA nucleotidyltransferase (CCA-adding enzyme)